LIIVYHYYYYYYYIIIIFLVCSNFCGCTKKYCTGRCYFSHRTKWHAWSRYGYMSDSAEFYHHGER